MIIQSDLGGSHLAKTVGSESSQGGATSTVLRLIVIVEILRILSKDGDKSA